MVSSFWPLAGLQLGTPSLELRWPTVDDLHALAALAAQGVHDPRTQPFSVPWTDAEPPQRARSTLQYHWAKWASWSPANWSLNLVVLRAGEVVGSQEMSGRDFAVLREVSTGSWVGQRYQRQGIGTEMRAAVLQLAFDGLGAHWATSAAFDDNAASWGVSHKLGYRSDGIDRLVVRGKPVAARRLRLDREAWQAHRQVPVTIEGLAGCLADFGL
jgi:RimJ/RimL family protein N-acetyltransferase